MVEALTINIFCILIMVVILLSIALQKTENDKTTKRFIVLVYVVVGYLVINIMTEICEGNPKIRGFSYVVNLLAFYAIDAVIIAFSSYFSTLVGHVSKKWERVMNPAVFFTYFRIPLVLVLLITHNLFDIDKNGCYQDHFLVVIPYAYTAIVLLMLVAIVIRNKKYFSLQQISVMILYLLLPVFAMTLELLTSIFVFTSIALALSVLLVYVLIQSSVIENARVRESVLEELSSTDLLTGVNNRRAYYNRCTTLEPTQEIGVVFCDINGLKTINDNYGHTAGDKLIIKFAQLLNDSFTPKDVFRISGDEFVVITVCDKKENFGKAVSAFKEAVAQNDSISSVGYAYGAGCCVEKLVSSAEEMMYEHKREQYESGAAAKRLDFNTK